MTGRIYTIGHSTRSGAEFIAMLVGHAVDTLGDIRTVPRSRHNPQFEAGALAGSLADAGIAYVHIPELGGLRHARKDSPNGGWHNASFRGYADYMQTEAFASALEKVIERASRECVALMCAEGNPFRCHRSLVADALLARGIETADITSPRAARPHTMTAFARVVDGQVTYPPPDEEGG